MTTQVVQPRFRGFIAITAHPDGCAANVRRQVEVAQAGLPGSGIGNALVVGSSAGYGLASLLAVCFGSGAKTLGVCLERSSTEDKVGTAGWYNLVEAHRLAREQGCTLETINGDAFSHEVKREAVEALRSSRRGEGDRFGKLDLLIYSLAAPRRKDADSDTVWSSVLKPVSGVYDGKSIDLRRDEVVQRTLEPCTEAELEATIKVMGGEDWVAWVETLREADLLADGFRTVAFSYIGAPMTYPIYRQGTIGKAKEHLEATALEIAARLESHCGGHAWVSVNQAVVTQASAALPAVALYLSLLFKVMQEAGTDEGPIEQLVRLLRDHIGPGATPTVDGEHRIRLDDLEMEPQIQSRVAEIWERVTTANLAEISDYAGYKRDFEQLFGFSVPGIDYDAPTEVHRQLA